MEWSKPKKMGAFLAALSVSYGVGWFWIIFLDRPAGVIDGSSPGQIPFVALIGAVLISMGAIGLYLGIYAVMLVAGAVWFVILSPYKIVRWAIETGPQALGSYGVNVVATLIGFVPLYVLGLTTPPHWFEWAMALATIGFVSAVFGIMGGYAFMFLALGLSLILTKLDLKDPFDGLDGGIVIPGVLVGVVLSAITSDDPEIVRVTSDLGNDWMPFLVVAVYGALVYGLVRLTRWIKYQAGLVPPIGTQIARPSEPHWSPEPILAWRTWTLSDNGLVGVWRTTWNGEELVARCKRVKHKAPDWDCRCGIYALKERPAQFQSKVLGLVELSGTVIEHDDGYRGEQAKVRSLWLGHVAPTAEQINMLHSNFSDTIIDPGLPKEDSLEEMKADG